MRKIITLGLKLLLIAAVAGLALGFTNAITKGPIDEQTIAAANAARESVLPGMDNFEQIQAAEEGIDNAYIAYKGGDIAGYTAQITTQGYGGEIEVMVGMDSSGVITGINVGGSNFSETAGLGAKVKNDDFKDQFRGLMPPLVLNEDIDAVTAATISSRAVTDAVNRACDFLIGLLEVGGLNS